VADSPAHAAFKNPESSGADHHYNRRAKSVAACNVSVHWTTQTPEFSARNCVANHTWIFAVSASRSEPALAIRRWAAQELRDERLPLNTERCGSLPACPVASYNPTPLTSAAKQRQV
jgi:hypothetical protein